MYVDIQIQNGIQITTTLMVFLLILCQHKANLRMLQTALVILILSIHLGFYILNNFLIFSLRGERLAKAHGHSIQQAEMNAAKLALETCAHLFPHLNYQRRIMERSFKRQGVVTDTIRETWYQETLKKRQELGLDKPDAEIKEEAEDKPTEEETESLSLSPADMDLAEEEEESPSVIHQEVEVETKTSTSGQDSSSSSSVTAKKTEQQEAVRAEIREIEEKLQRKKMKKVSAVKTGEIEDGEIGDSEEDEEPAPAVAAGPSVVILGPPPEEEVKDKHREDQRKRWCDDRKPERKDKSHNRHSRDSRERERDTRDSYYRYDRRDRERPLPPPSRQNYYEYDHRQPRY